MKKSILFITVLLVLSLIMSISIPVFAAGDQAKYASIEDITNSDTIKDEDVKKSTIEGNNEKTTTITFSAASLKTIDAGKEGQASEGRPAGYAWLGIRITVPTEAKKFKENNEAEEDLGGKTTLDKYVGVNEDNLRKAVEEGKDSKVYTFDYAWLDERGDEISRQTIKVIINLAGLTVYKGDTEDQLWNKSVYEEVKEDLKAKDNKEDDKTDKEDKNKKDKSPKTGNYALDLAELITVLSAVGIIVLSKRK